MGSSSVQPVSELAKRSCWMLDEPPGLEKNPANLAPKAMSTGRKNRCEFASLRVTKLGSEIWKKNQSSHFFGYPTLPPNRRMHRSVRSGTIVCLFRFGEKLVAFVPTLLMLSVR